MSDHPPIAPPPAAAARPFWSVMIPTYEPDPEYLRRVLGAVLEQDPGPVEMEIALIDDGSRRVDPRDCIPAGAGDRVTWFRQPAHVGIGRNWNTCVARARGLWVHLLHQDDLVLAGFYARLRAGIESCPTAGAAFCRDVVIDPHGTVVRHQRLLRAEPGILDDWIEHLFVGLHLRASALVVQRRAYEALGGFRLDLAYALDWDMWKRIAAAYPLWYEPEALACYRRHDESASIAFQRSGANMAEIDRSIALSHAALPPTIAAETTRRTRENYARYATGLAWEALAGRHLRTAVAQLRAARGLASTRLVAGELGRRAVRAWREPR
ncbi:MAG TPA: glycosyltransferase [Candidatus Dormibacteraeota bacterium]|nr:glycosyltransferase [Candidatus Dormibacteraeota bacterium]